MNCPRCGRVDQVAKVTGIVARGMQHSYKSDWRTSSSLDEDDDVRLSFGYSDTSTTKQSTLARQLAFPDHKGGSFLGIGCCILLFSSTTSSLRPPGGVRKRIGLRACGRVLVRRCGRPRAVTARCRSLELSTFPGVENVALAPS